MDGQRFAKGLTLRIHENLPASSFFVFFFFFFFGINKTRKIMFRLVSSLGLFFL